MATKEFMIYFEKGLNEEDKKALLDDIKEDFNIRFFMSKKEVKTFGDNPKEYKGYKFILSMP